MNRWLEMKFRIKPGQFALVQAFFLFFTGIGMFYTVGVTVGDSLFLSSMPHDKVPGVLPWVYVGIAVMSFIVTLIYDRVQNAFSRLAVITGTQIVLALSVIAFRLLIDLQITWLYFGLSVWMEVCALLSITLFFSFAGDYFSPRDARRLYGFIAGGMALGTIMGGHAVSVAVLFFETRDLLYAGAVFLVINALISWRIFRFGTPVPVAVESYEDAQSEVSLKSIFSRSYVRLIGLIILLAMFTAVVVDYQMKWIASSKSAEELAVFFGNFYGRIGIAQLLFQFLLVPRLLKRLGIINCLMILPFMITILSGLVYGGEGFGYWGMGMLTFSAAVNFVRITVSETLDMPAREMLFLPLPTRIRMRAQPFMDGTLTSLARGLGGLCLLMLYSFHVGVENLSLVAAGFCVVLVIALLRIRPAYHDTLASTLQAGLADAAELTDLLGSLSLKRSIKRLLLTKDRSVVMVTLDMLKNRDVDDLAPALAILLTSKDTSIAVRSLECLGPGAGSVFLPYIRQALESESIEVRKAAVLALCRTRGDDAIDEVSSFLDSEDAVLRNAAVIGLGRYCGDAGRERVIPIIESRVESENADERATAATLLGGIGRPDYAVLIRRLLSDKERFVRIEALEAVAGTADRVLIPDLLTAMVDPDLKPVAIRALSAMPQDATGPLVERIRDRFWPIGDRRILMRIISRIGGSEVAQVLWENVMAVDQDLEFRNNAARALLSLKIREGTPHLSIRGHRALIRQLKKSIEVLLKGRAETAGVDDFACGVYEDNARICTELMLSLFGLRYDSVRIERVLLNLFSDSAHVRSRAMELLDEVLPLRIAHKVTSLLQPLVEKDMAQGKGLSDRTRDQLLESGPWIRAVTAYHLSGGAQENEKPGGVELTPWENNIYSSLGMVSFLKKVPLFRDVSSNVLLEQANMITIMTLKKDQVLFEQGTKGDSVYIVGKGKVHVIVNGQTVAGLGKGECVGEMAILDGMPRAAQARAADDVRLLCMREDRFRQTLADYPVVARAMLRIMERRLRKTIAGGQDGRDSSITPLVSSRQIMAINTASAIPDLARIIPGTSYLSRVALFGELSIHNLSRLAGVAQEVETTEGEVLFEQGDAGDSMYIVCDGAVDIIKDGHTTGTLTENASLGENALIASHNRQVKAVVTRDAVLLRLWKKDFERVLDAEPDMAVALLRNMSLRLRQMIMWG